MDCQSGNTVAESLNMKNDGKTQAMKEPIFWSTSTGWALAVSVDIFIATAASNFFMLKYCVRPRLSHFYLFFSNLPVTAVTIHASSLSMSQYKRSLYVRRKNSEASSGLSAPSIGPHLLPLPLCPHTPTLSSSPSSFNDSVLCSSNGELQSAEECERRLVRDPSVHCSAALAAGIVASPRMPL